MIRPKPHSDRDSKPPQHAFPHAWYGASGGQCNRCHKTLSEIDRTGAECVTDEHIQAARAASVAFARVRK